jgi:hypothetical protein
MVARRQHDACLGPVHPEEIAIAGPSPPQRRCIGAAEMPKWAAREK